MDDSLETSRSRSPEPTGSPNDNDERREYPLTSSTVTVYGDQQTATIQNTPNIQSGEEPRGGEETTQFRGNLDQASTSQNGYDDLPFSVQQHDSGRESISLSNPPRSGPSVATTLFNNYKFLLLLLALNLLSSDVVKLQDWAAQNFSINNPRNATDILLQLDEKGAINASDLHQLSDFFESIVRFDLVHVIDAFRLGDYNLLRQFSIKTKRKSRNPANNNGAQNSLPQTQPQSLRNFSDTANSTQSVCSLRNQPMTSTQPIPYKPTTRSTPVRMAEVAVSANSLFAKERRTASKNAQTRTTPSSSNSAGNTSTVSSNLSKHSKFQHPDREQRNSPRWDTDSDDNWLCSHYKRHCYVKFECCDKFWPCHRCHNNQSTCGQKKLKSRDTRMLKCVYCNKVQQFGEHCCNCGAKFANYYCGLCKHLSGKDDHPYHCEKCGICRNHHNRLFHCNGCGTCLDSQRHNCPEENSQFDECCICLEGAFTGCQILPCGHKVHKECATQMIRSGITRCPICRESFAHKLEWLPQNSRKRPGK